MSNVPAVPPGGGRTSLGVDARIGGVIAYAPCCVGLVFSAAAVAMEKQSRSLRFHAFQSLLLHGGLFAVVFVLWIVRFILGYIAGVLGFLITMIIGMVGLAVLAVQILLMLKAHAGEELELPFIGELARKWM
jgi:uncharacterized membrane protein